MRIRVEELEPKGHQVLDRRYYYPSLMIRIIDAPTPQGRPRFNTGPGQTRSSTVKKKFPGFCLLQSKSKWVW